MHCHRSRQGFTFLEIMLVVLIIGILVSIVVPKFGGRTQQARRSATALAISNTQLSIEEFEINYGRYPDDLDELLDPPTPIEGGEPLEYLDRTPEDAWGEPLIYIYPAEYGGRHFDLYSSGENREDERGEGDDITPWASEEGTDL
ncbi:type II secretion system protein GspG [Candidatus Sumerlaeota bacterium]|nr:type II secretion system protein GspG [Candidatus Sumerlaeota bacterium]